MAGHLRIHRVNLLSAIEGTGVATFTAETGLLSGAEKAGVFSTLEGLGAFSLAEKALPVIEDLRLLSLFESLLDVEAGFIFTIGGFIATLGPILYVLQITSFVPYAKGPLIPLELAFVLGTLTIGTALFAAGFAVSKLQLAADLED